MDIKTELEEEVHSSDVTSQYVTEFISSDAEVNIKEERFANFPLQNEAKTLDQNSLSKLEIKEEQWWTETNSTGISSTYDELKDVTFEHLPSIESPRIAGETKNFSSQMQNYCEKDIRLEIREGLPFSDVALHKERQFFSKDLKMNIRERSSDNEVNIKDTLQKEEGFLDQDPLSKLSETETKIEIKEEEWWHLERNSADISSGYDELKDVTDEHLPSTESPRSNITATSSTALLPNECPEKECLEAKSPKCGICAKDFTNISNLKMHKLIHKDKSPHKCYICGKDFTHLKSLKLHTFIHEGKKPHKCETCGKDFTQLSNLKTHHLIHESKKMHKCDICGKFLSRLSYLKTHKLIHDGLKPYKCDKCAKGFAQLCNLKMHKLSHEDKKPHKCAICGKDFTQLSHLKMHSLIHEGKKPHKCDICDKEFTQLSVLKRHKLIHVGEKPYKCDICGKDFALASYLKMHKLSHESKKLHMVTMSVARFLPDC